MKLAYTFASFPDHLGIDSDCVIVSAVGYVEGGIAQRVYSIIQVFSRVSVKEHKFSEIITITI